MKKSGRIIEFIVGALIAVFLIGKYSDGTSSRYLIDFIMPYQPFKAMLFIALVIAAYRLIGGKSKDYSPFFYKLFVRIFGDPSNGNKTTPKA